MIVRDRYPETPLWIQERPPSRLLVFTHIEKAAGTSFTNFLGAVYGRHLGLRYGQWATPIVSAPLETMPETSARDLFAFSSHSPWGVHRAFARHSPEAARRTIRRKTPLYATILRDPAERFYSGYRYIQSTPSNPRHDLIRSLTFGEFLDLELRSGDGRRTLDLMCWMVTGRKSATFAEARTALLHAYAMAAPVERSTDLIDELRELLHWPETVAYQRRNTTRAKPAPEADELERARRSGLFDEDQRLYDFVAASGVLLGQGALSADHPPVGGDASPRLVHNSGGRKAGY
jgi:hypothetical protein